MFLSIRLIFAGFSFFSIGMIKGKVVNITIKIWAKYFSDSGIATIVSFMVGNMLSNYVMR